MKNKPLAAAILLLILLGVYLISTSGCRREAMIITSDLRPARKGTRVERGVTPMYDVSFGFNKKYRLTLIKVVAAQDLATNKYPRTLWHLVADPSSAPVKAITYGKPIPGMKPAVPELEPEPLEPNTEYVLLVEAGKVHTKTNFVARERPGVR